MISLAHKIHAGWTTLIWLVTKRGVPLLSGFTLIRLQASYGLDHANGDECGLNLTVFIPMGILHSPDSLLNRIAISDDRYRSYHEIPSVGVVLYDPYY